MKFFSANLASLPELYRAELGKALDLEETTAKALPLMIQNACDPQLKQAFNVHLLLTERHAMRLKRLLRGNGSKPCRAIRGLVAEAEDAITDVTSPQLLDAALITIAQRIDHYEMAMYGTLKTWASMLNKLNDFSILSGIEKDERQADEVLSSISNQTNMLIGAAA